MNIPERVFRFKQFSISHNEAAMKVGTDAVLLGAWVKIPNETYFLDIGCGSGIISLMLAQRSKSIITAVEIDPDAYLEAVSNVSESKFKNQINVVLGDISELDLKKKYSLIVCNPPFYKGANSPELKRNLARHDDSLKPNVLFRFIYKFLNDSGLAYVIYPFDRREEILQIALSNLLYCVDELQVKPNYNKSPHRCILGFSKLEQNYSFNELSIEKENRHDFSEEYKKLTSNFYLKF